MTKIEIKDTSDAQDDDLYNTIILKVDSGQNPLRVDRYVMSQSNVTSRNRVQQAAQYKNLYVNGENVKANYKVKPGDEILMVYPKSLNVPDLTPQDIHIDIVHEDDDIIVVNKEAGLVVHPGVGNRNGTLVNALMYHTQNLAGKERERAGIVHRIDKNTSGLLVVAKTEEAMSHLAKQFFNRTINRRYWAIVWGDVEKDEGTIEGNIGRDQRNPKIFTVYPRGDYGKKAITHYKVIERYAYVTLIECKLETGRTHQIRVHLKHIGHTLFNDDTYGGDRVLKGTIYSKYKQFVENCFKICPRQALHAKSLGFIHPRSNEEVYFETNLPEDMEHVLDKWRTYAKDVYRKNSD